MKVKIFLLLSIAILIQCKKESSNLISDSKTVQDSTKDKRPNIVVILADDLGYNDVGFNGTKDIKTPELDALAHNGVIFTNGYVTHPYCGPSRAGLITGRYQARFGMENNVHYNPTDQHLGLPLSEKTFAKRLQNVGYRTGIIGKWHLGGAKHFQPLQRGFDYFYGFLDGGHNYFPKDVNFGGDGYAIPIQENHGLGEFDEYLTTDLSKHAAKFIKNNQDNPFLLYVAYNAPHAPLEAPQELIEKYKHIEDPERRTYLAMIDAMDQGIGLIVDALKETGDFENTLIFFLSDNGGLWPENWWPNFDWADNYPFRRGKVALTEGGIHVPFIAHWPAKIKKGRTFDGLVSALDIAATSVAISGAKSDSLLEGVNLTPYFTGIKKDSPHDALFWRLEEANHIWAVRTSSYKYMNQPLKDVGLSFFDMINDPYEKKNIVGTMPNQQKELAELWNNWNRNNINNILFQAYPYKNKIKKLYDDFYDAQIEQSKKRKTYTIK